MPEFLKITSYRMYAQLNQPGILALVLFLDFYIRFEASLRWPEILLSSDIWRRIILLMFADMVEEVKLGTVLLAFIVWGLDYILHTVSGRVCAYFWHKSNWQESDLRNNLRLYAMTWLITVAGRSKAWTVFARSNAGIVGSNPTQGMDVCVRLFSVCCPASR
jgi:hypothetical protein